jgi:hypothetical protein
MDYKTNKTQEDIVVSDDRFQTPEQTTTKVAVPGIRILHTKSTEEIAEVLSNVMRSRSNVTEVRYVIGKYIELTTQD